MAQVIELDVSVARVGRTTEGVMPTVNTREESPIWFLGTPTLIRATAESTNGAFGLIEHLTIASGFASPYHMHHVEDEAFYVLEGSIAFVLRR